MCARRSLSARQSLKYFKSHSKIREIFHAFAPPYFSHWAVLPNRLAKPHQARLNCQNLKWRSNFFAYCGCAVGRTELSKWRFIAFFPIFPSFSRVKKLQSLFSKWRSVQWAENWRRFRTGRFQPLLWSNAFFRSIPESSAAGLIGCWRDWSGSFRGEAKQKVVRTPWTIWWTNSARWFCNRLLRKPGWRRNLRWAGWCFAGLLESKGRGVLRPAVAEDSYWNRSRGGTNICPAEHLAGKASVFEHVWFILCFWIFFIIFRDFL